MGEGSAPPAGKLGGTETGWEESAETGSWPQKLMGQHWLAFPPSHSIPPEVAYIDVSMSAYPDCT